MQLLNVDTCSRVGPVVAIGLSTSANSSIVLHPDGSSETVGNISVQQFPCNESHTQMYRLSVTTTEDYTLYGEIIDALLPTSCIHIPVLGESPAHAHYNYIIHSLG